jgi:hypothetical protein
MLAVDMVNEIRHTEHRTNSNALNSARSECSVFEFVLCSVLSDFVYHSLPSLPRATCHRSGVCLAPGEWQGILASAAAQLRAAQARASVPAVSAPPAALAADVAAVVPHGGGAYAHMSREELIAEVVKRDNAIVRLRLVAVS